jgi:ubiquinone/menaquinone biosynthesis C-methylase UbiE
MFAYDNVDMTCDVENLPLRDNCVDVIINESLLEHVPAPGKVVGEMRRVLKEGGMAYCLAPFMLSFHAAPGDYTRWTIEGLRNLYKDFEILELKAGGPTAALLSITQEWVAIIGSFGSRRLYLALYLVIIILTFPLKFLDIVLKHHPYAKNIADVFYLVARKPLKFPTNLSQYTMIAE